MNNIDSYLIAVEKLNRHRFVEPLKYHYINEPEITPKELKKLSKELQEAHKEEVRKFEAAYKLWYNTLIDLETNLNVIKELTDKKYWTPLDHSNNPDNWWLKKPETVRLNVWTKIERKHNV